MEGVFGQTSTSDTSKQIGLILNFHKHNPRLSPCRLLIFDHSNVNLSAALRAVLDRMEVRPTLHPTGPYDKERNEAEPRVKQRSRLVAIFMAHNNAPGRYIHKAWLHATFIRNKLLRADAIEEE